MATKDTDASSRCQSVLFELLHFCNTPLRKLKYWGLGWRQGRPTLRAAASRSLFPRISGSLNICNTAYIWNELWIRVEQSHSILYSTRMSLVITDPKAEQLAQELAQKIGSTIPDAIVRALEAQLVSLKTPNTAASTLAAIRKIAARCNSLPDLDSRSADEILGYGKNGLPQ
jgi:antitoxin VapB